MVSGYVLGVVFHALIFDSNYLLGEYQQWLKYFGENSQLIEDSRRSFDLQLLVECSFGNNLFSIFTCAGKFAKIINRNLFFSDLIFYNLNLNGVASYGKNISGADAGSGSCQ